MYKTWQANAKMRVVKPCREIENGFVNVISKHTTEGRCEICPLSHVRAGVMVRIKQLCAAPAVQNRLREIGLGEEQIIRLLTGQNSFICELCNARLAISSQLAQLIMVERIAEPARI